MVGVKETSPPPMAGRLVDASACHVQRHGGAGALSVPVCTEDTVGIAGVRHPEGKETELPPVDRHGGRHRQSSALIPVPGAERCAQESTDARTDSHHMQPGAKGLLMVTVPRR